MTTITRNDELAIFDLGETKVQFRAQRGERVLSATAVDGCFLVGTNRRVVEWNTQKGWRTLAHAEDRDG